MCILAQFHGNELQYILEYKITVTLKTESKVQLRNDIMQEKSEDLFEGKTYSVRFCFKYMGYKI